MEPVTPSCHKPVHVLVEPPKLAHILSTESIQMEPLESEEASRMIHASSRKKADLDTALKERIDRFEKLKQDVLDLEKHLHQFYNMRLPMIRTGRRRIRRKAHEIVRRFPCIFENCKKSYSCKSALRIHLRRIHQTRVLKE